jgi:hypothetical protein
MSMPAFIKAHLASLASGLAAVIFVGLGAWGMMRDNVVREMENRVEKARIIQQLKSQPRNKSCIEAEAERGQLFQKEYDETVAEAQRINARKPLMDGVFPVVEREATAFQFRDAYEQAMFRLPRELDGGDCPSAREIEDAQADIDEIAAQLKEENEEGGETAPAIAAGNVNRNRRGPVAVSGGGPTIAPMVAGGRSTGIVGGGSRSGTLSMSSRTVGAGAVVGDPNSDAQARADITKARSIRCYISGEAPPYASLHLSPIVDHSVRPEPEQMWYAQVELWIQQDIVNAIVAMNDDAAKKLKNEDAYVENMPVKRLQSMRVLGYWGADKPIPFPAAGGGLGAVDTAAMKESFTERKCDPQFDVVRFRVVVVVDQRELLALVDRITKQNFYKLIDMSFAAVTSADPDAGQGYLYGSAPVVRATLDFEGYMARSVYEKLFPAEVREALGIKSGN